MKETERARGRDEETARQRQRVRETEFPDGLASSCRLQMSEAMVLHARHCREFPLLSHQVPRGFLRHTDSLRPLNTSFQTLCFSFLEIDHRVGGGIICILLGFVSTRSTRL